MLVINQVVIIPLRLQYEMILVFFFASVLLCSLPLLHSATDGNIHLPNCPKSFSCPRLAPFNRYPFYEANDTQCGLIKISCTSEGGTIQLGGKWYEITGKFDFGEKYDNIVIHNQTFADLVNSRRCEALTDNFTSPSPLLYSITITPFVTLFKCATNLNTSVQQTDAYFMQRNYSSYKSCKDHNFYYNYLNVTVPNNPPLTCQVVQLPALSTSQGIDVTNIFSLLNFFPTVSFTLSDSCRDCHNKRRRCDAKNGTVQCLEAIKVKQSRDQKLIRILAIAGSTAIFILIFVIFMIRRHCKSSLFSDVSFRNKSSNLEDENPSYAVSVFSHKELEHATKNFDPSHELGDGGFGAVYYGKLKDGREVAVKKLHEHNYKRVQQFTNEVEILTKLRHPNLVVLYGCTSSRSRELLLVYEYIPNGTVADHLHGEQANPHLLTWPIRMKIAVETASALAYLHASEIIHRDVKTNNILLDLNFGVKVADFGLSRLIPDNFTHVSTAPQGTPGYVDPQYHQRYQLTDKSDVYSFGVVLIELISSMVAVDLNRAQDEISLANLALNKIQKCETQELIDPVLGSNANPETMYMIKSVAELAFRCLQYDSDMRPTMNEMVDALKDIQAMRKIDTYDSAMGDLHTVNPLPLSETNDTVVLLKDFQRSPVSVAGEWQSSSSVSTTISSNGDRLSVRHGIT